MICKLKLNKKTVFTIICVILLLYFVYVRVNVSSIGDSFPDMNTTLITYMASIEIIQENGTIKPDFIYDKFQMSDYPEKQEAIKQILDKYKYYNKIKLYTPSTLHGNWGMTFWIMNGNIHMQLLRDWNVIILEDRVTNTDYIYFMKGKDSLASMMQELLAVLE